MHLQNRSFNDTIYMPYGLHVHVVRLWNMDYMGHVHVHVLYVNEGLYEVHLYVPVKTIYIKPVNDSLYSKLWAILFIIT